MRQQPGSGQAARDRPTRRLGLDDGIARATGALGPDDPDHLERGRDILEDLADILAQWFEVAATGRTGIGLWGKRLRLARQVIRQRLAHRSLRSGSGRFIGGDVGMGTVQLLEHQLKLRELLVELLRAAAEAGAAQHRDLQLQVGDPLLQ